MAASEIVPNSEHEVHRADGLLYTLMHHGWRKGVEQFRNRLAVRVDRDKSVSDREYEATLARLEIALGGWRPIDDDAKWGMDPVLLGWFESFGIEGADDPAPRYAVGFWHPQKRAWCDTHQVLHNSESHPTHYMPLPAPPTKAPLTEFP